MNELIKVEVKDNQQVVSARELHRGLGVKTRFSQWVEQNFKMFINGVDFSPVVTTTLQNQYGGIKAINDYAITLNMAEHVAMMSKTKMGSIYRQYFIDLEKKWNDPKEVVKRGYEILQSENDQLRIENNELKPKAQFADQISKSTDTILVRDLAKLLYKNGIAIGQKELFRWLLEKDYLIKRNGSYTPTQRAIELGILDVHETTVSHRYTSPEIKFTPLVTTKGQQYFINKFIQANQKVEA